MRTRTTVLAWAVLAACGGGGGSDAGRDAPPPSDFGVDAPAADLGVDAGTVVLPPRGGIVVTTHDDGTLDVGDDRGTVYLRAARAEALVHDAGGDRTLATTDCAAPWTSLAMPWTDATRFATGMGFERACGGLDWRVWVDTAHHAMLADVAVVAAAGATDVTVLRLTPLISDGPTGGLFVGGDIKRHRILDDGADVLRETDANLHYPNERRGALTAVLPIASRGNVVSNWNHAIADLDGQRHWVAGMMSIEIGIPTFGTILSGDGPLDAATGRHGFDAFIADSVLLFAGKPLHGGGTIRSETIYVDPLATNPQQGLEDYADAFAAFEHVTLWTARGHRVPNGWNSWSGSGSTGGLGTNIDEALMRACLDIMHRELQPFGIDYFQSDEGWASNAGDWVSDDVAFPAGFADFESRVQTDGLIPGVWIKPFVADDTSNLVAMHPDWMRDRSEAAVPGVLVPSANERVLDLGNDAAIDWVRTLMAGLVTDYHIGWLKHDFGYLAFNFVPRAPSELTSVEAYRRAVRAIREGLGPDVFYVAVGLTGLNLGVTDGMRLTLDDGPRWDEPMPFATIGTAGDYKQAVRTGSRRYYFHQRVWVSHDDLLFVRTSPDVTTPITLDQHETYFSFVGLSGALVKIGEDLRTLTAPQIQALRVLLPIYPVGGRPLDVFTKHYPEEWHLPIRGTMQGDASAAWDVVGLLNWGANWDYTDPSGPAAMPDVAHDYDVDLATIGLDPTKDYLAQEFWTETFLGTVHGGHLMRSVAARSHEVIALREALTHPQLLGTNRHFTQGATDLEGEQWDDAARTLTLRFHVDQGDATAIPFPYRVRVHAPSGFTASAGTSTGGVVTQSGEVVTVTFTPSAPGDATLVVAF